MAGNLGLGFGACAIAVAFFGSNFLPVKKFDTGDGLFFQWIMCTGIWFTGLIVQFARNSAFEPIATAGGVLWCTGNMCAVPVIQCIGLGLGMLIWGASNLSLGWASGNFGLFGITKNSVNIPSLNYTGFVVALLSMGIFFFVETSPTPAPKRDSLNSSTHHLNEPLVNVTDNQHHISDSQHHDINVNSTNGKPTSWTDRLNPMQKRIVGCGLAVLSGVFYGLNFNPPQYLKDHPSSFGKDHSNSNLDYVFSHFTGIFLASTVYFLGYCVYKKNKPIVPSNIVIPSFLSGCMWAIAQISFFIANEELEFVVSFPIISTGPGVVASLWGLFLFKEIQGKKNIQILALAFCVTLTGVIMIALSKIL